MYGFGLLIDTIWTPKTKSMILLSVQLYHANWRSDADIELLKDCIQRHGLIKNDRQIRVVHLWAAEIDKENPRCEVQLEEFNLGGE